MAAYKKKTSKSATNFHFVTRWSRNILHVLGHTTELCVRRELGGI
jgi:hypothetical protein